MKEESHKAVSDKGEPDHLAANADQLWDIARRNKLVTMIAFAVIGVTVLIAFGLYRFSCVPCE